MLVDVDWNGLMKSFYDKVRIKIACINPTIIPFERIMEMRKKLYILSFTIEGFDQVGADDPNDDDGPTEITVDEDEENLDGENTEKDLLGDEEEEFGELESAIEPVLPKNPSSIKKTSIEEPLCYDPTSLLAACFPPEGNEDEDKALQKTDCMVEAYAPITFCRGHATAGGV